MGFDWKENLADTLAEVRIIEKSKQETLDNFQHFCEFIAEPAFESAAAELKTHGIRSKWFVEKDQSITFHINFEGSSSENFLYSLVLPKNSIELKLRLRLRGRPDRKGALVDLEGAFSRKMSDTDPIKWDKEDIILNLVEQYRNFRFSSLTNQD